LHLVSYIFNPLGRLYLLIEGKRERIRKGSIFLNIKSEIEWFLAYELHFVSNDIDADPIGFGYPLWSPFIRYALDPGKRDISLWSMRDSYPLCQSQVEEKRVYGIPSFGSPGRLAQSTDSGAGKRRIFAIGNYVNQRLLKPLHDWLMKAL